MATSPQILVPDWPLPAGIHAAVTTRLGGCSLGEYASLNLADHVGDDPAAVMANRAELRQVLALPGEPEWLRQVHGTEICRASGRRPTPAGLSPPEADGAVTMQAGRVLAVLTADCLPVLACSRDGSVLGAFHAGWRGLLGGILEAGIWAMEVEPEEILVYLGPAIGQERFEVGEEVRSAFVADDPKSAHAFRQGDGDRFHADLYALARHRLRRLGVVRCSGGGFCTATDRERFFSYRRDGRTGRMATLIWRECAE